MERNGRSASSPVGCGRDPGHERALLEQRLHGARVARARGQVERRRAVGVADVHEARESPGHAHEVPKFQSLDTNSLQNLDRSSPCHEVPVSTMAF